LCNTRQRRGGFISLDEFVVLSATVVGDAAAVEDLRDAFGFSDADGNGVSSTKLVRVLCARAFTPV
jgi:Ca2+-binding EF-hand superfamily protein